jgi:DNA-binding NarL/FixJ family response regulator
LDADLVETCSEALDDMVFGGRLQALEEWVSYANGRGLEHVVFGLAEAQVNLRHGQHVRALTLGRALSRRVSGDGDLSHRVHLVAAQAAHVGSLEEEALLNYSMAREAAPDEPAARAAGWGEVMCLSALERITAHDRLQELSESVDGTDACDQVRMVDKQLSLGFRFGFIRHLSDARRVVELVPQLKDPLIRCSFRSMYSWALVLSAYYGEALEQARLLIDDAEEYRVGLALPYGNATSAAALAGLKEYDAAKEHIAIARAEARRVNDFNGIQNAYAIQVRVLLEKGDVAEACAIEPPEVTHALRSMKGEVMASRALALASLGRVDDALSLSRAAASATSGIETHQLSHAVEAVCALNARTPKLLDACERLLREGFATGAVDPAVTAYRANPDLLSALLMTGSAAESVTFLLRRAGDEELALRYGSTSADLVDPVRMLSPREREIYGLVGQWLPNREIAQRLFIAETTVKRHLQNIYNKTGLRSRTALALHASRSQATPATESEDSITS